MNQQGDTSHHHTAGHAAKNHRLVLIFKYVLKSIHFKKTVARSSFASKLWSFSIQHQLNQNKVRWCYIGNDHNLERKWTLWPLAKIVQNWIVDRSTACNFMIYDQQNVWFYFKYIRFEYRLPTKNLPLLAQNSITFLSNFVFEKSLKLFVLGAQLIFRMDLFLLLFWITVPFWVIDRHWHLQNLRFIFFHVWLNKNGLISWNNNCFGLFFNLYHLSEKIRKKKNMSFPELSGIFRNLLAWSIWSFVVYLCENSFFVFH